jgi:hypothetical protein
MHPYSAFCGLGPLLGMIFGMFASAAQAETSSSDEKSASMQLFLDIVGDGMNDTPKGTMQVDLGGVPLVLGAGDGIDGAGLGMTAGVNGSYNIPISSRVKLEGQTTLSKTRYISDPLFGAAHVTSEAALRYESSGMKLALQPKLGVSFIDAAIERTEYLIRSRLTKELADGWNLTATTAYAWRHSNFVASDSGETAEGTFGLSYEFAYGRRHPRLDLEYLFRRKIGATDSGSSELHAPSIAATFPLSDWFQLAANYCYDEATAFEVSDDSLVRRNLDSHRLGMTADWYFGGEAAPGLDLQADYSYARDTAATDKDDYQEHVGKVSLAFSF